MFDATVVVPEYDTLKSATYRSTKVERVYIKDDNGVYWWIDTATFEEPILKGNRRLIDIYQTYDNGRSACAAYPTLQVSEVFIQSLNARPYKE
jgi:hypothetical protein